MISNKQREKLADKYLDLAEALPPFGRGVISTLQTIREHQRKAAERAYERTRTPEDFDYEYLLFRLFDIYSIESIDHLISALIDILPSLEDGLTGISFSDDVSYQALNFMGTAWWNIGTLVKDPRGGFFAGNSKVLDTLPDEVDFVALGLHKILPSTFVLSLDVFVTDQITQSLKLIQNTKHLPRIRFKQLVPHGRLAFSHATAMAEHVMADIVKSHLERIRLNTQEALSDLLQEGIAFSSVGILPFVDVFTFKGLSEERDKLINWIDSYRGWWSALGFNFIGYDVYFDGTRLFTLSEHRKGQLKLPNRLIVLWDPFIENERVDRYANEKSAVRHMSTDTLDSLQSSLAILEFLRVSEVDVAELRRNIFSRLSRVRLAPFSMGKLFRLNNDTLRTSTTLNRLSMEFGQNKITLQRDLREVGGISLLREPRRPREKKLSEILIAGIKFRLSAISMHLEFAE